MPKKRLPKICCPAALLDAATVGDVRVVNALLSDPLVAEKVAGKDALGKNAALRIAAGQGHLPVVQRLVQEQSVLENVDAGDWGSPNASLRKSIENGHYRVVNFLLGFEKVKQDIAVKDTAGVPHVFIKISAQKGFYNITYLLIEAYKQLKLSLPEDVSVEGYKSLEDFFAYYQKNLAEQAPLAIKTMLIQFLPEPVTSIISDYDTELLSFSSMLNKP